MSPQPPAHQSKLSTSTRHSWEENRSVYSHILLKTHGTQGVVDTLVLSEDYHQSCRKLTKAGATCSSVLPLDEVELAEIGCLSLDTDERLSRVELSGLADRCSD